MRSTSDLKLAVYAVILLSLFVGFPFVAQYGLATGWAYMIGAVSISWILYYDYYHRTKRQKKNQGEADKLSEGEKKG